LKVNGIFGTSKYLTTVYVKLDIWKYITECKLIYQPYFKN